MMYSCFFFLLLLFLLVNNYQLINSINMFYLFLTFTLQTTGCIGSLMTLLGAAMGAALLLLLLQPLEVISLFFSCISLSNLI